MALVHGNPGPGSYCYIILFNQNDNIKKYSNKEKFQYTTNNRMELLAINKALSIIKTNIFKNVQINVYSDSKYVIDPINLGWLQTWVSRDFKKNADTSICNLDLWIEFYQLFIYFTNIHFNWVKGHNNNKYNEEVNLQAIKLTKDQSIIGEIDRFYTKEYQNDEQFELL